MASVSVTVETLVLPTYAEAPAEELPMFAENRVHQRSSGNPYPNRVVTRVNRACPVEQPYEAIHLENEWLDVVLLPQLGGRIYAARDKANGYDFFYRQHVMKPALIGLLGSWVSGGVEFNWPCHHRPSTYMPTDYHIEREACGAVTVWMSEHEPMDRMKGMVGVRLSPDSALLETRVRVYNRTPVRHSFLWWENAAVPVHEQYRLFFPPDVRHVQFHYRKNVTTYPVAQGQYNGIRMGDGVDISEHGNTRQPTSYFAAASAYDFFGGYDERRGCGVVHVADHHTAPGKKMFTWAYNQLSRSWEQALTDTDGMYAELMAGSYTNNQPDFSWLEPYETKQFTQTWYPIGGMGAPEYATLEGALSFCAEGVWVQTTHPRQGAVLRVGNAQTVLDLSPCKPVLVKLTGESAMLTSAEGAVLLAYTRCAPDLLTMPAPLPGNPTLDALKTAQECYLAGVHVQQYRDPTIQPDAYWQEALQRDPEHVPSLIAMADLRYRQGRYSQGLSWIRRAWESATRWNFHPESGKLNYIYALLLEATGALEAAYDRYMQAYWNRDCAVEALLGAAAIDGRRGEYSTMAVHAAGALEKDAQCGRARALLAVAKYRQGETQAAFTLLATQGALDKLDHFITALQAGFRGDLFPFERLQSDPAQTALDVADDLAGCGETEMAVQLLRTLPMPTAMTEYRRAYLAGDTPVPVGGYGMAYPVRRQDAAALAYALQCDPRDVTALLGLGCLRYHWRDYAAAQQLWEIGLAVQPTHTALLRCLAVVCYSHTQDRPRALALLQEAFAQAPHSAQLLFELSLVMTGLDMPAADKCALLESHGELCACDDLRLEWAQALNMGGEHAKALMVLLDHVFVPCEGGEHAVAMQYMFAHHALGRRCLKAGEPAQALAHFQAAQTLPDTLGAGLWNEVLQIPHQYYEALCLRALGQETQAVELFTAITAHTRDYFSDMHLPDMPCWQAMAWAQLNRDAVAQQMLADHVRRARDAQYARDAGFYKATPFHLSYVEDAAVLRAGACAYAMGMAEYAARRVEEAKAHMREALAAEPGNLYARLNAALW